MLADGSTGGGSFSLTRGLYVDPPDLCTRTMRTLLSSLPASLRVPGAQPRIIAVSTTGIGSAGVAALPRLHRVFYPTLLAAPHEDKLGLELVLAHVSGREGVWVDASEHAEAVILPADWQYATGLPQAGTLPDVVVIRPAWLTNSPVTEQYRVLEGQGDSNCKTIARADVAHFVAERVMPQWDAWKGRAVSIGY
jgi:hypothetical protein